ncbi:hypothetical protein BJX68DRAFT_14562 [Aspergillus pseudodeflectus]|uniref:N-acetyltransferase domain-containing protein n=1 Tax=Aspergillus pseudodeflectus TaxID=176178 RepID=A0ABR4LC17_9EURO
MFPPQSGAEQEREHPDDLVLVCVIVSATPDEVSRLLDGAIPPCDGESVLDLLSNAPFHHNGQPRFLSEVSPAGRSLEYARSFLRFPGNKSEPGASLCLLRLTVEVKQGKFNPIVELFAQPSYRSARVGRCSMACILKVVQYCSYSGAQRLESPNLRLIPSPLSWSKRLQISIKCNRRSVTVTASAALVGSFLVDNVRPILVFVRVIGSCPVWKRFFLTCSGSCVAVPPHS